MLSSPVLQAPRALFIASVLCVSSLQLCFRPAVTPPLGWELFLPLWVFAVYTELVGR